MSVETMNIGLAAALTAATRRVHARIGHLVAEEGLTVEQWSILDFVVTAPEAVAMSEIMEHVGLTGPSLTRAVDKLVTSALLYREVDSGDRRRVLVSPSKRGLELRAQLASHIQAAEHELAGSPEAAGQILQMLGGLAR